MELGLCFEEIALLLLNEIGRMKLEMLPVAKGRDLLFKTSTTLLKTLLVIIKHKRPKLSAV